MHTTSVSSTSTAIFELVRFVGGEAVPYRPYSGGCTSCCAPEPAPAPTRSCCH